MSKVGKSSCRFVSFFGRIFLSRGLPDICIHSGVLFLGTGSSRSELVVINWFITASQDQLLGRLSLDGRSKSEHVRSAIDAYLGRKEVWQDIGGPLVKRMFTVTAKQRALIMDVALKNQVEQAVILRGILSFLEQDSMGE